jgi:cobalt-zinc-cadmium efflux system protein
MLVAQTVLLLPSIGRKSGYIALIRAHVAAASAGALYDRPSMGTGHHHHYSPTRNERSLWMVLTLTVSFMLMEVAGAFLTDSLALLSDAAHMFTDSAALAIALVAVRIARRPANSKLSFGYHRFEVLAAAFNALLLLAVALYIVVEAWQRTNEPPDIAAQGMMAIATAGLLVNLIGMRLLHEGKEQSLNMRGAYLEVWSDMLGSLGVILGGTLILLTGWMWIDTVVAIGIGLWVVPRTWKLLRASLHVLLEGVPENIDIERLRSELKQVPGVRSIHDLHVWSLGSGKPSLTVHAVLEPGISSDSVLEVVREHLAREYGITHIAVQCEARPCDQTNESYHFPREETASQASHHTEHEHDHGNSAHRDDASHRH